MAVDLSKLYAREFTLSDERELTFLQSETGDVGCVVWDAALALCGYLDHCQQNSSISWSKQTVLEVGAGTGAVGLVAASLGAKSTITDLPEFVPLMQKNISENQNKLAGSCTAMPLIWGDEGHIKSIQDKTWQDGIDFILVADCVYYEESVKQLVETIVSLSSSKTTVLCSYEERELGNKQELQSQFFKLISEHFGVKEIPTSEQHPELSSPDIHLFKFTSKT